MNIEDIKKRNIKVKKRDKRIVDFDINRISKAISGANNDLQYGESNPEIPSNNIDGLVINVVKKINGVHSSDDYESAYIEVEDIQDIIEDVLIASGYVNTAKKFIRYRELHKHRRDMAENLMLIYNDLLFTDAEDMDLKRDNANVNTNSPMGTMLKIGAEGAKCYANHFVIPEKFAEAHKKHLIHIHDLDFSMITFNCCQVDLGKLLKGGFSTGHGYLREPNSIRSAASLACIAIQSNQNEMYGG